MVLRDDVNSPGDVTSDEAPNVRVLRVNFETSTTATPIFHPLRLAIATWCPIRLVEHCRDQRICDRRYVDLCEVCFEQHSKNWQQESRPVNTAHQNRNRFSRNALATITMSEATIANAAVIG